MDSYTTERLPNIMYFDNYKTAYYAPLPYKYSNNVVVSPPLTPNVSPLPPKLHNIDKNEVNHKDSCSGNKSSTNSSTQPPTQQHKHVCQFQFCGWSFKRYEHLKRHMLVHSGERPHTCDFPGCGKSFSRSDNFHAHYRTHTKKKQSKKRAAAEHGVINKPTKSQQRLQSNSMASTVAANAAAMVAVSQQFGQNGDKQVYYNTNVYEMNACMNIPSFMGVDMHNSSPMSPISPPTPSLSLLSHEQPMYSDLYYNNDDMLSFQPDNPSNHLLKLHTCPVSQCSRRFKRLEHLKRHMRIHTLEKPFSCTYLGCQKSFSRSDNLAQHTKTHLKHQDKRKKKQI